jgi:hypothetical protein
VRLALMVVAGLGLCEGGILDIASHSPRAMLHTTPHHTII